MPEIKRFAGFRLLMFFHDENPPHVHITGPGFSAKLAISDGGVIVGQAPSRVLKQTRRWIDANRVELMLTWDEFQE